MRTYNLLFAAILCFTLGTATAQEKDLKANTNQETAQASDILNLLNSKEFEFTANTAFPLTGGPKNLVGSGYSITFSSEMVVSYMPYYGRGYSGMALVRDKGMRFQGKPENFSLRKNKSYEVNLTVAVENDTYSISMSVSDSGNANLTISSNNRGTISYQGEVSSVQ